MRTPQILSVLTALVMLVVASSCKSGNPAPGHPSGALVEEPFEWSSQEREWLDGRTTADFQALMLHLDDAPMSDHKAGALRRELATWPDEHRVAPLEWAMRIADGEAVDMIEFARVLSFRRQMMGRAGLKSLVEQATFRQVLASDSMIGLDLSANRLDDASVVALAESPSVSSLTYLDLADNDCSREAARAIGRSPHLRRLTHLNLSNNAILARGVEALARSKYSSSLEYLGLAENYIGDRGAEHLAASENLGGLRHLELSANGIEADGVVALANATHIGPLRHLGLGCGSKTDWGESAGARAISALASASFMPNLRHLDISLNHIDKPGLRAVMRATENLEQLDLSVNRIAPDELAGRIGTTFPDKPRFTRVFARYRRKGSRLS